MADDQTRRGPQDATRINIHEEYEVQYWTQRFSVTRERLEEAVRQVGVSAKKVESYLGGAFTGSGQA